MDTLATHLGLGQSVQPTLGPAPKEAWHEQPSALGEEPARPGFLPSALGHEPGAGPRVLGCRPGFLLSALGQRQAREAGKKGGSRRVANQTPERRREIAMLGVTARQQKRTP